MDHGCVVPDRVLLVGVGIVPVSAVKEGCHVGVLSEIWGWKMEDLRGSAESGCEPFIRSGRPESGALTARIRRGCEISIVVGLWLDESN